MAEGFYVKFLGEFSLNFAGQEIVIEVNPLGKTMQMLYFLLKAGAKGCGKEELLELVCSEEQEKKKQMNHFRQQLFRARQLMNSAHFPKGSYIVCRENRYYFTLDYPIDVDTEKLDRLIEQMQNRVRKRAGTGRKSEGKNRNEEILWQQYEEYCEAYTGEFLPQFRREEWAVLESARYQQWYFTCLDKLSDHLKEQKKFEQILWLTEAASQRHPYDEWQSVQIDCLMALGRHREAKKVYKEASMFYRELGLSSLDRVMANDLQENDSPLMACSLEKVQKDLKEMKREKSGAYRCDYLNFIDLYRIKARMDEMNQEQSLLVLCTLSAEKGEWGEAEEKEQMELFQETLMQQTQTEDIYTQYSKNQYLVLLSGAAMEDKKPMLSRLRRNWKKAGGRAKVAFSVDTVKGS